MNVVVEAKPKLSPLFRMQWEEVQQCHVLLYPEGMVKLNQSAGEIMKRCDGVRNVADIVADLETNFKASGLRPEVDAFLDIAYTKGWLVKAN
jgi:pyrroloquinoline quinone biosynthesis protein D